MTEKIQLTKHAEIRAQERGFTASVVRFVATRGDVRKLARDGRRAIFISEHLADVLAERGIDSGFLNEVRRACVILKGQAVVTVHDGSRTDRCFNQ